MARMRSGKDTDMLKVLPEGPPGPLSDFFEASRPLAAPAGRQQRV